MQVERDSLITENRGLVKAAAQELAERLVGPSDFDDLAEYGMIGLVEAADRWDPSRGVSFSSFAYPRIRGSIVDGLRKMRDLPRKDRAHLRFAGAAAALLADAAAEPVGPARTLADEYNETADLVADLGVAYLVSDDASAPEVREPRPSAERQVGDRELAVLLHDAMEDLPERERTVLRLHYHGDLTLTEVGRELGISRIWAWKIHNRAIARLRRRLARSA